MSEVTEFLKSQTIFLTGVTGFLGKVLLWKALKEAGESIKIYVLVRPSKDGNAKKRLEESVFGTKIFDELLQARPQLKDCVIPLEGDIVKEGFGLSEADQRTLERETTVIIHSAATTKFTENLKLAVELNVLAVRTMLQIAKRCTKLVSIVQVSTAYVAADKPNLPVIQEQVYPIKYTPNQVIKEVGQMTLSEADAITTSMISPFPNTYTFTKALGEHIVLEERGDLPLCILRPSIVTAAIQEPIPGWIDVLLGPAGLFVATGVGALRVMYGNTDNVADFVPVDVVCNAILTAAWRNVKLAKETPEQFPANIPIYHVATSVANPLLWLWPGTLVPFYFQRYRPKKGFGYPFAFFCAYPTTFKVLDYTLHLLPAYVMDSMRMLQGKKPYVVKSIQKLRKAMSTLYHFTTNNWFFSANTMDRMHGDLNEHDKQTYNIDIRAIDWDTYFIIFCHGMRRFLLKEDEASKPIEKNSQQQRQQSESRGFFRSLMDYMRSYLLIISVGCLIYFFRQNFWLLKWRAKQLRQTITTTLRLKATV